MEENKLLSFNSVTDLVDFFNTHDMGEYMDYMPEAQGDVTLKQNIRLVAIDEAIVQQVSQIAKSQDVSVEQLINTWIKDQLLRAA